LKEPFCDGSRWLAKEKTMSTLHRQDGGRLTLTDNLATPTSAEGIVTMGIYNSVLPTYADGDVGFLQLTSDGRLRTDTNITVDTIDVQLGAVEIKDATTNTRTVVKSDGTGNALVITSNLLSGQFAEDTGHTSLDVGNFIMAVRNDGSQPFASADYDYAPLITDNRGKLWVTGAFKEDTPHTSGDIGIQALTVRTDTVAALGGTTGDYQPLITDASGRLYTRAIITDGTTDEVLPTTAASVSGASGANLLAAGSGTTKHKIFKMILSVDTTGTVTISDGIGVHYMTANVPAYIDFRPIGLAQSTADTAITVTNGGGGNFSASLTYSTG